MNIQDQIDSIINKPIGGYINAVIDDRFDGDNGRSSYLGSAFSWSNTTEGQIFWDCVNDYNYDKAWNILSAKQKNRGVDELSKLRS